MIIEKIKIDGIEVIIECYYQEITENFYLVKYNVLAEEIVIYIWEMSFDEPTIQDLHRYFFSKYYREILNMIVDVLNLNGVKVSLNSGIYNNFIEN
jgi:hypothetical protein